MNYNEVILGVRQRIVSEFKKYEYMILPIMKFILVYFMIHTLAKVTNYTGAFSDILPMLILALMGAFLPAGYILMGGVILATLFIFPANPLLAIVLFILLTVMYIGFMRLFPNESLLVLVTLMAFLYNAQMIVPILAALLGSFIGIVPIVIGTVIWYVLPELALLLQTTALGKSEVLDVVTNVSNINLRTILLDPELIAVVVVFFVVFSVIYIIRKLSIDYAPYIAIAIGAVVNLVGFILAIMFFGEMSLSITGIII